MNEPKKQPKNQALDESHGRGPHSVGDLVTSISLVLAAWQVIPGVITGTSTRVVLMICSLVAGVLFYLKLKNRIQWTGRAARWALPSVTALAVLAWMAYDNVSLRNRLDIHKKAGTETGRSGIPAPGDELIHKYLDAVYNEHANQWNGEFEKRYARPTLYLLSKAGVETKPVDVQRAILRWRSGSEDVSRSFNGMVILTGEPLGSVVEDEQNGEVSSHALRFLDYVARPMADSDLLNKKTRSHQTIAGSTVSEDVPERVLVLGDPASGKSTMLDRLDMVQARRARGSNSEAVPVYVKLKGAKQPSRDALLDMVRDRLGVCADHVLTSRTVMLMVDAIDEADDPPAAAKAVIDMTESGVFVKGIDRVIVTGRLLNYSNDLHGRPEALRLKGYSTAVLYGLDQTAIEKQILGSAFTSEQKARIMQKLVDSSTRSAWLQFLRLPMNFDLIGEIMADLDIQDISQSQTEIMRRFVVRRFVQKGWNESETDDAITVLVSIATNLLDKGVAARSRDFTASDALVSSQPTESKLREMEAKLARIQSSGLIKKVSPGRYRYFHLNLQDYFAALGLKNLEMIEPSHTGWRQILLFHAGLTDALPVEDLVGGAASREPSGYLEELELQIKAIRRNLKVKSDL